MINEIQPTGESLTSRSGLCIFNNYLENVKILELFEKEFGYLRRSSKSQPVYQIIKQLIHYFVEGSSFRLTRFDEVKAENGYGDLIGLKQKDLLSSHQVKRFFKKLKKRELNKLRKILKEIFICRLKSESPNIIVLNIDTMVMDNNEAKIREGVEYTYKKVKGFQPLQLTWNNYIIDGLFRSGKKHSNYNHEALKMIKKAVRRIRNIAPMFRY